MENLTNIIEAILFASGNPVPTNIIVEKLGCTQKELKKSVEDLHKKFNENTGILLLEFNGKLQLCTNPTLKDAVSSVLNPIKEKEFTRTILECAAIIAYKQPITKAELEQIRGLSSDYAVSTLLELQMIEVTGKRETVGRPNVYGTTDNFLKRFKLSSLEDLPDYETLLAKIAAMHQDEPEESYLYDKPVYENPENKATQEENASVDDEKKKGKQKQKEKVENDFAIPDFLNDLDEGDIIKIE